MVAKRGIMFELQTSLAPDADKALSALEKRIDALHGKMRLAVSASARGGRTAASASEPSSAMGGGSEALRLQIGDLSRAASESDRDSQRRMNAGSRKLMQLVRDGKQALADAKRARDLDFAREQKSDADFWKSVIVYGKESKAEREKQSANEKRQLADLQKARDLQFKHEQKTEAAYWKDFVGYGKGSKAGRERGERRDQREAKRQRREAELSASRQREAQQRLTGSLNDSLDAVMRLSRGFVELGLVGEQDTRKIMDALLAVQGTIDTVRGGVDVFRTFRGALDAMRNVRSLQGLPGAGGGILRTAGSVLGFGTTGVGAAGTAGGAATAGGGLAAASGPIAAFVAAVASAALAIKATASTISDTNRYGFRGGAAPGSYNYIVGGAEEGLVRRGINMGHSLASGFGMSDATYNRLARFALNSSPVGMLFSESVDAAQSDRDTQSRIDKYQREKKAQDEINARHTAAFEEKHQERISGYRAYQEAAERRARLNETSNPQVDLQARLERLVEDRRRMEEIRRSVNREKTALEGPDGAIRNRQLYENAAAREKEAAQEILRIKEQQLQTVKELQKAAIDGLKSQLELQRRQTQESNDRARQLTQQQKGALRGISRLNPMEFAHAEQSVRRLKAGEQLTEDELSAVEGLGIESLSRKVREQREGRAMAMAQQNAPVIYGELKREEEQARNARRSANEYEQRDVLLENKIGRAEDNLRKPGAEAPPIGVDVKFQQLQHKILLEVGGSADQLTKEIADELAPQMVDALKVTGQQIAKEVADKLRREIEDSLRQRNTQGRVIARGGG